jgi:hypothetical protein
MLASANARNYGAYARTRAAALCFGGWGLQAMLHLWPRLRLIQEEREVLGRERELPNLDRLTAFAAILPELAPAASSPPFHILQPNLEQYPAPFYLERQLASIATEAAPATAPGLTHAERVGARLLQRACADGYLRPLPVTGLLPADDGASAWPVTRAGAFQAGMAAAGPIVRTLLSQVVDPTRLDSMQTHDPFVQTTIYVIAPLGEPRTSALVWPVVSELVEAFGRRHVSRVIAFLSTASFAPDDGWAIEEATTHMALRELEALTGIAGQDDRPDFLARLLADCGGRGVHDGAWKERVGRRLFDAVYLVDREKSNQALAESALDLAVLVGNTVEAFLTADGLGHIERSLGPEMQTGRPAYNVVGAASDYIPLAEYVAAAIEEEQKGVLRAAVLAAGPQPATMKADLQALDATPETLVRRFLDAAGAPLFTPATDRATPVWPPTVQIAAGRLRAQIDAGDLRLARDPQRWLEFLQGHTAAIAAEVEEAFAAAQVAWGGPPVAGGEDRTAAGATTGHASPGVIPRPADLAAAANRAAGQIVADMRRAPDGILHARARLASWLDAVSAVLRDLQPAIAAAEADNEGYRARLYAWQSAFASAVARRPQTTARWSRILAAAWLVALGLAAALLLGRAIDLGGEGRIALATGLAAMLAGLSVAAWRATVARLRQLERQRVALAQEELSRLATRLLQRGLFRAYSQLAEELAGLQATVEEALADLTGWAHAGPELAPSAGRPGDAPTRAAITHESLWAGVQDHIRRESADGAHTLERFRALWHAEGDDAPPWAPEDNRLARRLAAALAARGRAPGAAPSLAGVFKEYAARATADLCPTHRLLADHPDLAREIIEQYSAERLLAAAHRPEGAGAADHNSADVVERLYVRAKPAAGFEVTYLLSADVLEVEFGVSADAPTSPLRRAFEQRGLPLFSSHDPLSLTLIRTVNRLGPAELILTERCRDAYLRLNPGDRARLSLLPATEARAAAALYGEDPLTYALDTHAPTRTPA